MKTCGDIFIAQRYRSAAAVVGATGALAAGVTTIDVGSSAWLASVVFMAHPFRTRDSFQR